jgi:phosphoribosylanthranilate isomerase
VFYQKSPRRIAEETARDIISQLPQSIEKVGVFVYGANPMIGETAQQVGLNAVQMHVDPSLPAQVEDLALPSQLRQYWSFPASQMAGADTDSWTSYVPMRSHDAIFLDSGTKQQPGGTGKVFDWKKTEALVQLLSKTTRVAVAGGLTPENVNEAMRTLRPWGVDVSSGVEASPRKKDPQKIRAFVQAVRASENT